MQHKKEFSHLSEGLLEALAQLPVPIQASFLRQYHKIPKAVLARKLKIRQAYLSKPERSGMNHLLSNYEKIADSLGCRPVLVPRTAKIVARVKNPKRIRKSTERE